MAPEPKERPSEAGRFVRYTLLGSPMLIVNYALLYLTSEVLEWNEVAVFLVTNEGNIVTVFSIHQFVTFRDIRPDDRRSRGQTF